MEHLFFFSIYVSLKSIKTTNTDSRRRFQTARTDWHLSCENVLYLVEKSFHTCSKANCRNVKVSYTRLTIVIKTLYLVIIVKHSFWTLGISQRGPIKQDLTVLLSFHTFVQVFSWNCIIIFFWIWAWCQKPIWSCAWQSRIFWKNFCVPKFGKMDWKWAKNRVFWMYWKIWSLVFTEFVL